MIRHPMGLRHPVFDTCNHIHNLNHVTDWYVYTIGNMISLLGGISLSFWDNGIQSQPFLCKTSDKIESDVAYK